MNSSFLLFCSIQTFNKQDDAQAHLGGQSTLLTPTVQMLFSSLKHPQRHIQNTV
jgi:hypothetical protein